MTDELFSVKDQIVLISGGSRGLGKAIAGGFAERGSRVVITGRNRETVEKTAAALSGDKAVHPMVCDVSKTNDIKLLAKHVIEEYGRIDTLINVAGVNIRRPAEDFTEQDFDFVMDINIKGAFLLSKLVGRQMILQGRGSQINIASLNTDRPLKHCLPYAVSKAGMGQMTRLLALEWGSKGVRVNALAPGFFLTDMSRKIWADKKMMDWSRATIPLGRLGDPDELIGTAIFLASGASAYVTGQIFYVDGGFNAGWAWPIPSQTKV